MADSNRPVLIVLTVENRLHCVPYDLSQNKGLFFLMLAGVLLTSGPNHFQALEHNTGQNRKKNEPGLPSASDLMIQPIINFLRYMR